MITQISPGASAVHHHRRTSLALYSLLVLCVGCETQPDATKQGNSGALDGFNLSACDYTIDPAAGGDSITKFETLELAIARLYGDLKDKNQPKTICLTGKVTVNSMISITSPVVIAGTTSNKSSQIVFGKNLGVSVTGGGALTLANLELLVDDPAQSKWLGIRVEGSTLTAENVTLRNAHIGIDAKAVDDSTQSAITVRFSEFIENGSTVSADHASLVFTNNSFIDPDNYALFATDSNVALVGNLFQIANVDTDIQKPSMVTLVHGRSRISNNVFNNLVEGQAPRWTALKATGTALTVEQNTFASNFTAINFTDAFDATPSLEIVRNIFEGNHPGAAIQFALLPDAKLSKFESNLYYSNKLGFLGSTQPCNVVLFAANDSQSEGECSDFLGRQAVTSTDPKLNARFEPQATDIIHLGAFAGQFPYQEAVPEAQVKSWYDEWHVPSLLVHGGLILVTLALGHGGFKLWQGRTPTPCLAQ